MKALDYVRNKLRDAVGDKGGVSGNKKHAGMRDPEPFKENYSNGLFLGQDDTMWLYFKFPEDVKMDWTRSAEEAADNQSFLTGLLDSIGDTIYNTSESTRNDQRLKFHIPMVANKTTEIQKYEDITPAQYDFLDRMGGFPRIIWNSYFGIELKPGDINSELYKTTDKVRNWVNFMTQGMSEQNLLLYKGPIRDMTSICFDYGMRPLSFSDHPEDFENLTSWFGDSNLVYSSRKELSSTIISVPTHGRSLFAGGDLGELSFAAITPMESQDMFTRDPHSEIDSRFGTTLLAPSLEVVHINIRGEIRSPQTAANIFDNRNTKSTNKMETDTDIRNTSVADRAKMSKENRRSTIANTMASQMASAWLDNVEITIAHKIKPGEKSEIAKRLAMHGMNVNTITGRQPIALASTIPGYPNPIFPIPRDNNSRNPNVNNFYSGVLAMSGLFGSTKPAAKRGILLGFSDSGFEYKEIFHDIGGGSKKPTILITGNTGAGKALSLDTKVVTPHGMVRMGDIHTGDEIITIGGKVSKVSDETDIQYDRNVFSLCFSDGQTIKADRDHQHLVIGRGVLSDIADDIKTIEERIIKINTDSLPEDKRVSAGELYDILSGYGVCIAHWSTPEGVEASINFSGIESEDGLYELKKAIIVLKLRIAQHRSDRYASIDNNVVRLSTGEIARTLDFVGSQGWFAIPNPSPIEHEFSAGAVDSEDVRIIARKSVSDDDYILESISAFSSREEKETLVKEIENQGSTIVFSNAVNANRVASIARSLGKNIFHIENSDEVTFLDDGILRTITGVQEIESTPVKCITVEDDSASYLIGDFIPTSNTIQILMMLAQATYLGHQVIMLNPKPQSSLAPFFELLDGIVVNMSNDYLDEHPGLLDPVFFLHDRVDVARLLNDMIVRGLELNRDSGKAAKVKMEELYSEIVERAQIPSNECSWDIIMGNHKGGANNPRLSDDEVVDWVRNKLNTSAFWKSAISKNPEDNTLFDDLMYEKKPMLIEWDTSIQLPNSADNPDNYTPRIQEGIQSVVNLFQYSREIIGSTRNGGILAIDEAHVLRTSPEVMETVRGAGKTWRSSNITLLLATQDLNEFLGDSNPYNIGGFVRMYIIMEVSDKVKGNMDIFFDITGLPRTEFYTYYISHAGMTNGDNKPFPNAYIIDEQNSWEGGIICGPWPTREMRAAQNNTEYRREKSTGADSFFMQDRDITQTIEDVESEDSFADDF